ncbi:MAG: TraR/DksA family transcriptional regulator [Planctomycetaceae bacterium]|nr:TraR/DksA family transcriptional regulator [Planctomycetaceae bacterium]
MAEKARVNKDKKTAKSPKAAKATKKPKVAAAKPAAPASMAKCPLSKSELAEVRQLLLQKRQALLGDLSGMEATAMRSRQGHGDLSHMPTHLADLGSDNYEQEFTLGLLESERSLLVEIDQALERIERGTYGVCLGTGEPIGKSRLMARPWAKYTIEYARLIEKGLAKPVEEMAAGVEEEDEHVKGRPAAEDEDLDEDEDEEEETPDEEEDEKERDEPLDDE